jgi:hypothetical protein
MLTRALRLGSLVAVSVLFAAAGCGGKVAGVVAVDKDAGVVGVEDAGVRGDDAGTGDDAGGPAGCPADTTLIALGASCDWAFDGVEGPCTVSLDACETGEGSPTPVVCFNGTIQLPPGEGIACTGHTGGDDDAGTTTPSTRCTVGASCSPGSEGSTCTNAGAGPCSSDQRLVCKDGAYLPDGFPCTADPNEGCGGSGPNGCSEQCSCVNGDEVCTGDCPDAGPGSP